MNPTTDNRMNNIGARSMEQERRALAVERGEENRRKALLSRRDDDDDDDDGETSSGDAKKPPATTAADRRTLHCAAGGAGCDSFSSSSCCSDNIRSLAATAREAKEESAAAVTNNNTSSSCETGGSSSTNSVPHHHQSHYNTHTHNTTTQQTQQQSQYSKVMAHDAPSSGDESSSTCSNNSSSGARSSSLLDPYPEPCFHTIRQTFHRFQHRTREQAVVASKKVAAASNESKKRSRALFVVEQQQPPPHEQPDAAYDSSSDAGSSEGGYAGSASSNTETNRGQTLSSLCTTSSCGEESSEESGNDESNQIPPGVAGGPRRLLLRPRALLPHHRHHNNNNDSSASSSEIADFSSTEDSSVYNSNNMDIDDGPVLACFEAASTQHRRPLKRRRLLTTTVAACATPAAASRSPVLLEGKPPILALGCDIMAHVLTFLEPPDVLDVLTMPLSKDWLTQYTRQPELWRVLCVLEPFKANVERQDGYDSDDDETFVGLFPFSESALLFASNKDVFGKYRLLYSSFVKCMRYLMRIKDDSVNGRPLSVVELAQESILKTSGNHGSSSFGANQNLQQFLSQARGATVVEQVVNHAPVGVFDNNQQAVKPAASNKRPPSVATSDKKLNASSKKVKYGQSKLTQRLLGPSVGGSVAEIELPWSCAIYSIVNWMVAFSGVEGIQIMCLKVLPFLLEDEQQRITAQRVGLTDVILRSMLLFRNSTKLHTAAFHTIVLLARPLGGREGMLFHTSMVNSSGIFGASSASGNSNAQASSSTGAITTAAAGTTTATSPSTPTSGKSGIAVLLDSMRRFRIDTALQAMACWSLVNIALAPAQKEVLVKLGGIEVTVQAMTEHPHDAEVQFRALFALINLVIPCNTNNSNNTQQEQLSSQESSDETSESDVLDEMVDQIIDLVVLSIKNFCANEAILNRACLVLHNLSLTQSYHAAMLASPTCYQMLEFCLNNFRTDQVLQQSAAGTLHRLQTTLSSDAGLRSRFALAVQAMRQESLKQAQREAMTLSAHEERLRAGQAQQSVASVARSIRPEQ